MQKSIEFIKYEDQYQQQVIELILGIQQGEYDIPLTLDDQPDLKEIKESYHVNNGNLFE